MSRAAHAVSGVISIPLAITRESVLHFLGYPELQAPPERIDAVVAELLPEARALAKAVGVYESVAPSRAQHFGLEPLEAAALVIGLVTIGGALEQRASELIAEGAATRALILDAAGSAAVEEAADRLSAIIGGSDEVEAGHVSCRISPGYGRWDIRSQRSLFAELPHAALGVTLLPSMLMSPRKSISFAMWLGADARPLAGLSGCTQCELERCRYRRS